MSSKGTEELKGVGWLFGSLSDRGREGKRSEISIVLCVVIAVANWRGLVKIAGESSQVKSGLSREEV